MGLYRILFVFLIKTQDDNIQIYSFVAQFFYISCIRINNIIICH